MTKPQRIILLIFVLVAAGLGVYKGWFNRNPLKQNMLYFDRPMKITHENVDWEFGKPQTDTLSYLITYSDFILKADNTLNFTMNIPKAPVVLESILGTQLGKNIFQIPFQSFKKPQVIDVEGIGMSSFNPFEPINLLFIYEYDSGTRIRHTIIFEIN